jgi:hypothetical protein
MKIELTNTQRWLNGNNKPCGNFIVSVSYNQDPAITVLGYKNIIV